ncbi:MAG: alpha-hydroxy-acid oxidizing protein [Frankiales bacterium]|nr:alpha-hydroxy-acid oxidizing protein [Frankiales bacterium]
MTAYDELESRARSVLPPDVFGFLDSGAGEGRTLAEQEAAWAAVRLRPRVLRDVSTVSTATAVLGTPVAAPVLVAPSAAHALCDPDGEVATASGTRGAGSLLVLSMRASARLEDVAAAAGSFWQQIYVLGDRGISDDVARRAAEAGATALVLTVDTPMIARKMHGFASAMPRTGIVAELDDRNWSDARYHQAPDLVPADIGRLAAASGLPVVVKGVLRGDEAARAVDAGAAGVIVSTHGGRQLDGVVPVPVALAEVVDAVGDRVEVYADGGVRTGSDVLRALALGARAVLLGRPVLWALATGGAEGVRELLADLTRDVHEALALAGCTGCGDVGPDIVTRPA